ncbi:hypothetical protein CVT26_008642 [Gymnopilus dilepis]|uniref:Uncharacterized protein n=1 Tax=Gymnopilus dilepis TaxID=231916 RepID=A0A409XY08_9AGAR|nr:hypothetical protein CVT26_008642 [Gymnopilus dilepis]
MDATTHIDLPTQTRPTTFSTIVQHACGGHAIDTRARPKKAIASELWLAQMPPDKDASPTGSN